MGFLVSHAKKPSGSEAVRGPFIRASVCPCIRASLRKSAITFNLLLLTCLTELRKIFRAQLTPRKQFLGRSFGPQGPRSQPGPQKAGFLPNISPPRVLGQGDVSYLFGNGRTRQK